MDSAENVMWVTMSVYTCIIMKENNNNKRPVCASIDGVNVVICAITLYKLSHLLTGVADYSCKSRTKREHVS